jgi:hypothetical protein
VSPRSLRNRDKVYSIKNILSDFEKDFYPRPHPRLLARNVEVCKLGGSKTSHHIQSQFPFDDTNSIIYPYKSKKRNILSPLPDLGCKNRS